MSKRELIDCICEINKSAKPEFLASFSEEDLKSYLEHLMRRKRRRHAAIRQAREILKSPA
jgi:hypothetical protein